MLDKLLLICLQSTCLPCLAGGPKCQRCQSDSPHQCVCRVGSAWAAMFALHFVALAGRVSNERWT